MKKWLGVLGVVGVLAVGVPVRAQSGCDDSPENPTLILAGLAGAAFAVSTVRAKWKR